MWKMWRKSTAPFSPRRRPMRVSLIYHFILLILFLTRSTCIYPRGSYQRTRLRSTGKKWDRVKISVFRNFRSYTLASLRIKLNDNWLDQILAHCMLTLTHLFAPRDHLYEIQTATVDKLKTSLIHSRIKIISTFIH